MTFFTKEATPERGQNVWCAPTVVARLDRTSLARGHAEDDHCINIEFSVHSIEVTAWSRSSETGEADRAGYVRTPPSAVLLPTIGNWAYMTWKCPPKCSKGGVVDTGRIPKALPPCFDFGEEGRPSHDFSYFFHTFLPWVFRRRLFKVLRKKKNEIHCMSTKPCTQLLFLPVRSIQLEKGRDLS